MSQAVGSGSQRSESMSADGLRARWVALVVPVLLVAGVLALMIGLRDRAESAVAGVANLLPLGFAFAAGVVASVNPCGFLMLPTYISYHLGTQEAGFYEQSTLKRAGKALALGGVATVAFVVVLTLAGGIIAAGGQWLVGVFPFVGVAIGAGMALLGLWLLITQRTLGIMAASRVSVTPQRNLRNVFLFGIAYAAGSLSCTLPIFLVVAGSSLAGGGVLNALGQFLSYALGMGSILIAVTVGAALFRGAVARWLRAAVPHVHRVSALFLLGAGAYLVYYWLFVAGLS